MSTLTLGGSTLASKSGSDLSLDSGVTFPAGHIIQIVNVPFNDQLSVTGGTAADVKEFDALTITSGSKLLIQLNCSLGGDANTRVRYLVKIASGDSYSYLSTCSGIGSNTLSAQSGTDSMTADEILLTHNHSTNSTFGSYSLSSSHLIGPISSTYFRLKLQLLSMYSETASINRRANDTTASGRSYITFMEIAQ